MGQSPRKRAIPPAHAQSDRRIRARSFTSPARLEAADARKPCAVNSDLGAALDAAAPAGALGQTGLVRGRLHSESESLSRRMFADEDGFFPFEGASAGGREILNGSNGIDGRAGLAIGAPSARDAHVTAQLSFLSDFQLNPDKLLHGLEAAPTASQTGASASCGEPPPVDDVARSGTEDCGWEYGCHEVPESHVPASLVRFETTDGALDCLRTLPASLEAVAAANACAVGQPIVCAACRHHRARCGNDQSSGAALDEKGLMMEGAAAWLAATMYWAHPSSALPAAALVQQQAALEAVARKPTRAVLSASPLPQPWRGRADDWTSFFWARRRDWEDAFRSLYMGLRAAAAAATGAGVRVSETSCISETAGGKRHCICEVRGGSAALQDASFYVHASQLTVLFCLSGAVRSEAAALDVAPSSLPTPHPMRVEREMIAMVSQSTQRLRERLRQVGVAFSVPFDAAAGLADLGEQSEDGLQDLPASEPTNGREFTRANKPHQTALLMRGHMAVHGLYDVLLEQSCICPGTGLASDVPLLVSRHPFVNGTLRRLQTYFHGRISRSVSAAICVGGTGDGGAAAATEAIELAGPILPSAVQDMVRAMSAILAPREETGGEASDASGSTSPRRVSRGVFSRLENAKTKEKREVFCMALQPQFELAHFAVLDGMVSTARKGEGGGDADVGATGSDCKPVVAVRASWLQEDKRICYDIRTESMAV